MTFRTSVKSSIASYIRWKLTLLHELSEYMFHNFKEMLSWEITVSSIMSLAHICMNIYNGRNSSLILSSQKGIKFYIRKRTFTWVKLSFKLCWYMTFWTIRYTHLPFALETVGKQNYPNVKKKHFKNMWFRKKSLRWFKTDIAQVYAKKEEFYSYYF